MVGAQTIRLEVVVVQPARNVSNRPAKGHQSGTDSIDRPARWRWLFLHMCLSEALHCYP